MNLSLGIKIDARSLLSPFLYLGGEQNEFKFLKSVSSLYLPFRFGTEPKGLTHLGFLSHTFMLLHSMSL